MTVAGIAVAEADLHCHILPAWDDGPRTLEDSLSMAARASEAGIKTILVTPHVGKAFGGKPERAARDIPAATAVLQGELQERGIALQLIPGAEITLGSPDLPERIANEPWLTVGGQGHYVLVEALTNHWPDYADQLLFQISLRKVTPIIAHPERYDNVQRDPSILEQAVKSGVLLQITARSLLGEERPSKRCCLELLEAGMVAIIASDTHAARGVLPGAVEAKLYSLVGEAAAQQILVENPRRVLAGESVPRLAPVVKVSGRRKLWDFSQRLGKPRLGKPQRA
ncbi:MAG TPA: CpsB/CapC family capsule biosynthesis tyrosine phosphatase [Abditibacteriaceae bacterium]|nr:CpsB/CapC family capsule biosynthesis tyrosine phosphatase [Abditibacteriaceae bacterium]